MKALGFMAWVFGLRARDERLTAFGLGSEIGIIWGAYIEMMEKKMETTI